MGKGPLVLVARALSVAGPLIVLHPFQRLGKLAMPTLVWGGLRGGISIALALSLGGSHAMILAATYIEVLLAVLIQGGTIGKLIIKWTKQAQADEAATD